MDIVWDGIARADTLNADAAQTRSELADATKSADWPQVFEILSKNEGLINTCRLGGKALYAPLHQAAYLGASVDVIKRMLRLGAWRTLQNARGERPVDIAEARGHEHLSLVLRPEYKRRVPLGVLLKLQMNFHEVILGRARELVQEHALRLPELEPLLEIEEPQMWFAVPGMYGGFRFSLKTAGAAPMLVSESWCRVVGGSGERHEITSAGSKLVDEGFV